VDKVIEQIKVRAKKYKIEKVVLFGSRARGNHSITSDYDIAVFGDGLSPVDEARFCDDAEEIETLKKIDVVFIKQNTAGALLQNIMRDGVIIYEQVHCENK